jgi:hypothetical protein
MNLKYYCKVELYKFSHNFIKFLSRLKNSSKVRNYQFERILIQNLWHLLILF